ncbi:MAG: ABC transporter permease [Anaerolineales bacterium]|nr:ABC transporter permease [Anaerolineales bacterium]
MKRYWIVAQHEIISQLRRKSFIFFALIFPLLMLGVNIGIGYFTAQQAEKTGKLGDIGYIDRSGVLRTAADKPEEFIEFANVESAREALTTEKIGAYFVVPDNYLASGVVEGYTFGSIPYGIEQQFSSYLQANLLAHRTPGEIERLQHPAEITMKTLDGSRELDQESAIALIFAPIGFAVVFGMSITMTSSYLMQNVAEEKENRMVEMMMTSIKPIDMLWGKILGLGALGVLQILIWSLAGIAILIFNQDVASILRSIDLPAWMLYLGVIYLLLGYLLYGSLLAGIGALTASAQEAQSISAIFSIIAISPTFALMSFFKGANDAIPVALSLFPFTSSSAMIMRIALGQVPSWQIVLSLVLLAVFTAGVVWAAAWAFRIGLLMTGKRLGIKTLIAAIRRQTEKEPVSLE